jgi:SNF2 family DNA or RNA helicase
MCREPIVANKLIKIVGAKDENVIVPAGAPLHTPLETIPKKPDALLHIFQSNPEGRFLVFSRYDNPLEEAEVRLTQLGIKVKMLRGNKDAIAATLRAFQAGHTRCLLLNSRYAGAGLNITAASHVILLHAMTHEEEKQILGRAYRLGRTEPLQLIKLLHEGEVESS